MKVTVTQWTWRWEMTSSNIHLEIKADILHFTQNDLSIIFANVTTVLFHCGISLTCMPPSLLALHNWTDRLKCKDLYIAETCKKKLECWTNWTLDILIIFIILLILINWHKFTTFFFALVLELLSNLADIHYLWHRDSLYIYILQKHKELSALGIQSGSKHPRIVK